MRKKTYKREYTWENRPIKERILEERPMYTYEKGSMKDESMTLRWCNYDNRDGFIYEEKPMYLRAKRTMSICEKRHMYMYM